MSSRTFPIRYSRLSRWFMTPLLLGARHGTIQLTAGTLVVRMGWAFRAEIPRSSIRRAARQREVRWAIGVHSDLHFTSWLVNGSRQGIVFLDLDPPAKGRSGPFPITIRRLGIGIDDPDGFLRALGVG